MISQTTTAVIRQSIDKAFGSRANDPDIKKLIEITTYLLSIQSVALPKQAHSIEMIEDTIKSIIDSSV